MKKLRKQNIHSVEDVFFAQIQSDGSLYVNKSKNKDEED